MQEAEEDAKVREKEAEGGRRRVTGAKRGRERERKGTRPVRGPLTEASERARARTEKRR